MMSWPMSKELHVLAVYNGRSFYLLKDYQYSTLTFSIQGCQHGTVKTLLFELFLHCIIINCIFFMFFLMLTLEHHLKF